MTLKQTYLSALPVDSLLRIEHQRALAFLCGGGLRVVCGTNGTTTITRRRSNSQMVQAGVALVTKRK